MRLLPLLFLAVLLIQPARADEGAALDTADRAAIRLATLGRPVKKMIGGITGWIDEGFPFAEEA